MIEIDKFFSEGAFIGNGHPWPREGTGIKIFMKIQPIMLMKIFLSEITEDKYRNEILIKFQIFSASHVVIARLTWRLANFEVVYLRNSSVCRGAVLYYWVTYLFRTGSSPDRDKIFICKKKKICQNVCGLAVAFRSRWFHRHIPGMPRYVLAFLHLKQPCA